MGAAAAVAQAQALEPDHAEPPLRERAGDGRPLDPEPGHHGVRALDRRAWRPGPHRPGEVRDRVGERLLIGVDV